MALMVGPNSTRSSSHCHTPQTELIAHVHHLAGAEVDLDEFGTADWFAVLVLERRHNFPRVRVNHVGRVAPGVTTIEAEGHPAVAALTQIDVAGFLRRRLCRIENKQFFSLLIADPK